MTGLLLLIVALYVTGWIVCVCVMHPRDTWEGCVAFLCGLIWPVFLIGWLVSRPFA